MAGKDIDLVIRARDRATSEVEKISKALKKNVEDQQDLAKGAGKTSAALGKLATDAAKFQTELSKLQSAGKVAAELDKATSAVTRMEGSLRSNAVELAKMARETDAAAQAANRLKGQLAAEENSLASNKLALSANRKELSEVNKLVAQAERNQARYNETLNQRQRSTAGVGGKNTGAPQTSARSSAGVFISADLAAAKESQAAVTAQVREQEKAVKASTDAIKAMRPQVSAASAQQRELATATERASLALTTEKQELATARTGLASIKDVSQQAATGLGLVTTSQEAVSAASLRAAANIERTKNALAAYSKFDAGSNTIADPKAAANLQRQGAAVEQARADMKALQEETKRLAIELKNTSGNATAQVNAFTRMSAASRAAETEFRKQISTLNQMRGVTQTSFASWASATIPLKDAAAATAKITTASGQAAGAVRGIAPAVNQAASAFGSASSATGFFGQALANVGKDSRQTLSLMQRLRGEILSLTASYIGFQAALSQVGGAITAFRQLEAVQSRLGAVYNQDTTKVAAEIQFLQQQADRLGISFSVLADEYGKFSIAAKSANFTTGETRKIFLSVAEAARVNKLSVEQTSGVFLALTQMISKGKVSSEELRRQLGDRLPGAFNIFAKAIGVSTAELDEMMKKGEVLSDRSTMLKFADEMSRRFGPQLGAALNSVSTDIGRFENNIFNAQLAIANGFIPSLRQALQSFNQFSQSTEGQAAFKGVGEAVGALIQILAEVPKYFDLITLAAKAFVAVKIADIFTGMIGRVVQTTQAMSTFSREMQLIGPRTQAAAASQGVLSRGLSQTVSVLGSFRQNLLASTSQTALARVGVIGLAGSVGILQTALVATAGVARAFLAAFGGPLGLAITAITFGVGQWLMSVDNASSALEEHKRQIDIVTAAYNSAGDKAGDWAKKISGVTVAQAVASLETLKKQFQSTVNDAEVLSRTLRYAYSDFPSSSPQVQQLNRLQEALKGVREGTVSIKELETSLNEIALNAVDDTFKEIALEILNMVNNAADGEVSMKDLSDAISKSEAQIRLMNGTATEGDRALLGLAKATGEANDNFDKTSAVKAYTDAIDTLKGKIPALADEMKKLKDITEINKAAWDGLIGAWQSGDYGKIGEILKLWTQAGASINDNYMQKKFDGLPDSSKTLVDRIIYVEGGQTRATDTNKPGSSAQGIGQFTGSTWLPIFNRLFPALQQLTDAQKLEYRYNEQYARPVLEQLTKQNQMALANAGVSPTDANSYLAHFLGSGDAIKVLLANPEELAKNIVQPASTKANPTVIKDNTTVRDLQNWAASKVGGGSQIMSGGQTKAENFNENLDQRIKGWKDEANARKESNREGTIAKALAEAENEARKAGVALTKEQIADIRESVGAKYDSAHADEALKENQQQARDMLNDIVGLDQQRKVLLQEIQMAQNAGDGGRTEELKNQLAGVNEQLASAIPKALELARALGDEKMVAQLQKVQLNTAKVGTQISFLGLNFNQVRNLAGSFADGLVNAFDNFAQAVANGENVMDALKNAFLSFAADFLRQIATMILKQMIFNALNRFFPGLGLGVGAAHTGGMVGSSMHGGGNAQRQVSPMWFQNAVRYHSGGIAGLRPDEVPAVLKKNEEVLTEQDPRHRFNQGQEEGTGSGGGGTPIKQVLVLDNKDLSNAMSSSHGERVVVTHIKNNAATIRKVLGL